jgi:hypothetical protein
MKLFKKLKEWATDSPAKPAGTLAELYMAKGPTCSVAAEILRQGLPFHIQWSGEGIRNDN